MCQPAARYCSYASLTLHRFLVNIPSSKECMGVGMSGVSMRGEGESEESRGRGGVRESEEEEEEDVRY